MYAVFMLANRKYSRRYAKKRIGRSRTLPALMASLARLLASGLHEEQHRSQRAGHTHEQE